jgi:hypothetical protein
MNLLVYEPSSQVPARRLEPAIAKGRSLKLPFAWSVKVRWQKRASKGATFFGNILVLVDLPYSN